MSPTTLKGEGAERWQNVEKAISFAATLLRQYMDYGDSQIYFALNADIPDMTSQGKKRRKIASWNDAPNDWDTIIGGRIDASARLQG